MTHEMTEIVTDPCATERREAVDHEHRSGSEIGGWDAGSLPDDSSRSFDARPLPRVWRQRTRVSDVARHEETGMRARMSF